MSTIGDMDEAVAPGLIPDNPDGLQATMEGLPGYFDTLARKTDELAVFAGGQIGGDTSAALTDLAVQIGATAEAARAAFIAYQSESAAWRRP